MELSNLFGLTAHANLLYLLIFLFSFFESLVVVGLLTPGTLAILFAGFLISSSSILFFPAFIFASLGAILGDLASYFLGRKGIGLFKEEARLLKISRLKRGENFFKKHGGKSIFLGRFSGPTRSIVPFVAGLSRMNTISFLIWNILSAFCWSLVYLSAGIILGNAWQEAEYWGTRTEIFIFGFMLLLVVLVHLYRYLRGSESEEAYSLSSFIALHTRKKLEKLPFVKSFIRENQALLIFIKNRFINESFIGLPLTVLSLVFLYALFLLFGLAKSIILSPSVSGLDVFLINSLYLFRDNTFIWIFYHITILGNWQTMVVFITASVLVFILLKKRYFIFPFLLSVIGEEVFSHFAKIFFHRPRPDLMIFKETTFSFPSGHASIAVVFYGFIAYAIFKNLKRRARKVEVIFAG